jgi:subtilisin family serine protease
MEKFSDVRNTEGEDKSIIISVGDTIDEMLLTLTFNERTRWESSLINTGLPKKIMELGKIKGLGIEELHKEGILGTGTTVAIIDQPLDLNHPEYKGKIIAYKNFDPKKNSSSMHGPAVTSLLVGNEVGVAPGTKVIYAAVPTWLGDTIYEVEALRWIIEQNKKLPDNQKIKFVSVSANPSSIGSRSKNANKWEPAVKKASEEGIEVIDCTGKIYELGPAYYGDIYHKEDFENLRPGFHDKTGRLDYSNAFILTPTSLRTVAEAYGDGIYGYTYCGQGGLSWGIPYIVGTLLLGSELNKTMSAKDLIECLYETRYEKEGFYYINPKAFLELVKSKQLPMIQI